MTSCITFCGLGTIAGERGLNVAITMLVEICVTDKISSFSLNCELILSIIGRAQLKDPLHER